MADRPDAIVIGAGVAGLACAVRLVESGLIVAVIEADERVGGRMQTDVVDGFTLDRGFHVFQTAYPACRELLDYRSLRLSPFEPGAVVRFRNQFTLLGDPWRCPRHLLATATSPIGTIGDKLRIARLRFLASRGTLGDLYSRPSQTTLQRLRSDGFTEPFINDFFRPFLGGIFLESELATSSRMLEFVFRMFSAGEISLPADGIAAIPRQLADRLPRGTLRLGQHVVRIENSKVRLASGEEVAAHQIVVATENSTAAAMLGDDSIATSWRATSTHYFACEQSPDHRRMLVLAGDEYERDAAHRIASVVVLSDVAPQYAPQNKTLVSVTVSVAGKISDQKLLDEVPLVRSQLRRWYGTAVENWIHLKSYHVAKALPATSMDPMQSTRRIGEVVLCGDYLETPSLQGALSSGINAAKRVLDRAFANQR